MNLLGQFNPQQLSCLAWSYAKAGHANARLDAAVAAEASDR